MIEIILLFSSATLLRFRGRRRAEAAELMISFSAGLPTASISFQVGHKAH